MVQVESPPVTLAETLPRWYVLLNLELHLTSPHTLIPNLKLSFLLFHPPKKTALTHATGLDLSGATFWEFADKLSPDPHRMRRIVQYPRNVHYSDVSSQISPAWHQWLRHTRADPPSLQEQSQDLVRQEQLKILAAQADARWAAKKSYLDAPGEQRRQPVPALRLKDPGGYTEETRPDGRAVDEGSGAEGRLGSSVESSQAEVPQSEMQTPDGKRHPFTRGERARRTIKDKIEDPWKKARGGPSEEWQPQAWDPNTLAVKR
jgi:NADH dehydrogenase [ubiquinone] 1 alpha subcomplex assembly factor 2